MARAPRIEVPGGIYHLGSRGNRGCQVYMDDREREVFLAMFGRISKRHGWELGTYCLMTNHYHLLMTIESGLSDGMRELNGGFSSWTNAKNGLDGHLFKNRFWYEPVKDEAHYLQAARYIVLNPVRAGICATPEGWRWSSYRAIAGLEFAPSFLAANELLKTFAQSPAAALDAYRRYVQEGVDELRRARHGVGHRDERLTR
jgi:REP element-mobilizing transposase RayT